MGLRRAVHWHQLVARHTKPAGVVAGKAPQKMNPQNAGQSAFTRICILWLSGPPFLLERRCETAISETTFYTYQRLLRGDRRGLQRLQ